MGEEAKLKYLWFSLRRRCKWNDSVYISSRDAAASTVREDHEKSTQIYLSHNFYFVEMMKERKRHNDGEKKHFTVSPGIIFHTQEQSHYIILCLKIRFCIFFFFFSFGEQVFLPAKESFMCNVMEFIWMGFMLQRALNDCHQLNVGMIPGNRRPRELREMREWEFELEISSQPHVAYFVHYSSNIRWNYTAKHKLSIFRARENFFLFFSSIWVKSCLWIRVDEERRRWKMFRWKS